jgi:alpha-glucosidase (family GH31 glycosyl hydrolase)
MTLPERYVPDVEPVASPAAVVRGPDYRFTVLTPRLLRLEHDPDGTFEDRASQTFWYRDRQVPEFEVTERDDRVTIQTSALRLEYDRAADGCSADSLSIDVFDGETTWTYGADDETLGGAVRTVDEVDGATALQDGLVSRSGWTVVDDTDSLVFGEDGWVQPRDCAEGYEDLYFFGYGQDYRDCLADYAELTGPAPMVPRWALGNWWSRYWEYTQSGLQDLVGEFRDRDLPLSVCMIDMDWHVVENDHHRGWTGWTWDEDLFPDPAAFVDWLHEQDVRTGLNLHPADGVHPHEDQYEALARDLGIDPESGEPVAFDAADTDFLAGYFEHLIHPMEREEGIDFWWIDWQQWDESPEMPGLDPMWALNHTHAYDRARDGRRPFILSRWAGLGSHRYPVGFSGDCYVTWDSLRFQPTLTAASANVDYGWWSHDIGGHFGGTGDPDHFGELYARWLQFGVFSPVNRIHSAKDRFLDKRPWTFEPTVADTLGEGMRLRHALVPYLYTMAWRHHRTGYPLVEPMYYDDPDAESAYHCPQQYRFGTELVVAPHVEPRDDATNRSRRSVWLPEGEWVDLFTGDRYDGGWHVRYGDLSEIPAYAKAGAIVPMGPDGAWSIDEPPERLRFVVTPGADNTFELFEDDGVGREYRDGDYARTTISQAWDQDRLTVTVDPTTGERRHVPQKRTYEVCVRGVAEPDAVSVDGAGTIRERGYDSDASTLTVTLVDVPADEGVTVTLETDADTLLADQRDRLDEVDRLLRAFELPTMVKGELRDRLVADPDDAAWIEEFAVSLEPSHVQALVETLYNVGFSVVTEADGDRIVLWNEADVPVATRRFTTREPVYEPVVSDWDADSGPFPEFDVVDLEALDSEEWEFEVRYGSTTVATHRRDATVRQTRQD